MTMAMTMMRQADSVETQTHENGIEWMKVKWSEYKQVLNQFQHLFFYRDDHFKHKPLISFVSS